MSNSLSVESFLIQLTGILLALLAIIFNRYLYSKKAANLAEQKLQDLQSKQSAQENTIEELNTQIQLLLPFSKVADATEEAKKIIESARAELMAAELEADRLLVDAGNKAAEIMKDAHKQANEIAGEAIEIKNDAKRLERVVQAMKNIIEGYGNLYIVPTISLLDELAEKYGFTEAGEQLKRARNHSKNMVKNRQAADCDYAESGRKETASDFVVDAFNGKVDSILTKVKHDNVGTLEQKIKDAYVLVNHNGKAFRNARVSEQYLAARLDELKWAAIVQELKLRDEDEQRRIRQQIREEEKARKEFERAIKDSEKEEEALKKAILKVRIETEKANEEQRKEFEAQLTALSEKLRLAEEKNQRALSMAQQTRAGHVYIISNLGSFGDDIVKIGMTRRLEPLDRIRELGDASVPFPFDIHAMIFSEDAPTLEKNLHSHFLRFQVNKVNSRKEFFRTHLKIIREEIEKLGVNASWTMTAEAREYRESLAIEKSIADNPERFQEWANKQEADFSKVEFENTEFDADDEKEEKITA